MIRLRTALGSRGPKTGSACSITSRCCCYSVFIGRIRLMRQPEKSVCSSCRISAGSLPDRLLPWSVIIVIPIGLHPAEVPKIQRFVKLAFLAFREDHTCVPDRNDRDPAMAVRAVYVSCLHRRCPLSGPGQSLEHVIGRGIVPVIYCHGSTPPLNVVSTYSDSGL